MIYNVTYTVNGLAGVTYDLVKKDWRPLVWGCTCGAIGLFGILIAKSGQYDEDSQFPGLCMVLGVSLLGVGTILGMVYEFLLKETYFLVLIVGGQPIRVPMPNMRVLLGTVEGINNALANRS